MVTFFSPKRLEVGFNSFNRVGELVKEIGGVTLLHSLFTHSPTIHL